MSQNDDPWAGGIGPFARDWDAPSYDDLAPTRPIRLHEFSVPLLIPESALRPRSPRAQRLVEKMVRQLKESQAMDAIAILLDEKP